MSFDPIEFIRTQTAIGNASIIPEIKLHLATEVTPLWQLTEKRLKSDNLPPPFWAFAWPGGQGVSRYVLDHPEEFLGKRVMDWAAGSGIAAIAAMMVGAKEAVAIEIDPLAIEAIRLNAALNNVAVTTAGGLDMMRAPKKIDVILAGDVCYQQAMAAQLIRWLYLCVAAGIRVLIADPGRAYVPQAESLRKISTYVVPTSKDLEDHDSRTVVLSELVLPPTENDF